MVLPLWFHKPPPSLAAVLPATTVLSTVTTVPAMPETWTAPPLPGFAAAVPATFPRTAESAMSSEPSMISTPPPARLAVLSLRKVAVTVTTPSETKRPPPEPLVPVAALFLMKLLTMSSDPPTT